MFRTPCFAEKIEYVQFNLGTPRTLRGNFQTQSEIGMKFSEKDRDNFYEWYNAYFLVNFKFEASANVGNVTADTQSALINSSFSWSTAWPSSLQGKCLRGLWQPQSFLHQKPVLTSQTTIQYSPCLERSFWRMASKKTAMTQIASWKLEFQRRIDHLRMTTIEKGTHRDTTPAQTWDARHYTPRSPLTPLPRSLSSGKE